MNLHLLPVQAYDAARNSFFAGRLRQVAGRWRLERAD